MPSWEGSRPEGLGPPLPPVKETSPFRRRGRVLVSVCQRSSPCGAVAEAAEFMGRLHRCVLSCWWGIVLGSDGWGVWDPVTRTTETECGSGANLLSLGELEWRSSVAGKDGEELGRASERKNDGELWCSGALELRTIS